MSKNHSSNTDKQPILKDIIQNIVDVCAQKMKLSRVTLADVRYKDGKIFVALPKGKKITGTGGGIFFLLHAIFKNACNIDDEVFWKTERTNSVYFCVNGKPLHQFVQFLFDHSDVEGARLCAIQEGPDFREGSLGKMLFGKMKVLKSEVMGNKGFSSPTSLLEGYLPLLKSKNIYEVTNAFHTVFLFFSEGFFYFSGKRREALIATLNDTEKKLQNHPHPMVQACLKMFSSELATLKNRHYNQEFLQTLVGKDVATIARGIKEKRVTVAELLSFAVSLTPSEGPSYRDISLIPQLDPTLVALKNAYSFYRALLTFPLPVKKHAIERANYLVAVNNCITIVSRLGEWDKALEISKKFLDYAQENIYIAHSAACAFAKAGDKKKALELVEYAVFNNYPKKDALKDDKDLAVLHDDPRFAYIFSFPQAERDGNDVVITEMFGNQKVLFRITNHASVQISDRNKSTIAYIRNYYKEVSKDFINFLEKNILDFYKTHYEEYKKKLGSAQNSASKLPKITKNLKIGRYLSDLKIYLPAHGDYSGATFGLVFKCAWDPEQGIGIRFENFNVKSVGTKEVAFFD